MRIFELDTWPELSAEIEKIEATGRIDWLFRGVSNAEYGLVSKIGRPGARKDPSNGKSLPHSDAEEAKMLESFKRTARPYLEFEPRSDLEWMAVAQHHGAPTRLLDWTESPLIAAYFAVEKSGTDGAPAIYVHEAPPRVPAAEENQPLESIKEVRTYLPTHVTPRIQVQRSVFTYHPCPATEYSPPDLVKWVLPAHRPSFLLRQLIDRMGYNRAALFPDLQGLAEHVGWRYKWCRQW